MRILLFIVSTQSVSATTCYSNVTVNWIVYPEWHDGAYDENAITVSLTGENTTGNHQASFRNLSDKKIGGLMSLLLTAQTTGRPISVTCSNPNAGYSAKNVMLFK